MASKTIYQLKISLKNTKPPIWRTIQIASTATFWELHCAIQDAFAWNNSHLHYFRYEDKASCTELHFGIPVENEYDDLYKILPGWKHKIQKHLNPLFPKMEYVYDFGDNWEHVIKLEEVLTAEKGIVYPRCIKGRRNSPPDDCGGVWGYEDMLEILADPAHDEYEDTKTWVESIKGGTFKSEEFDPRAIVFADPAAIFDLCIAE